MRYVILRDDDTNAFTQPDRLERLYRPFLDRGLPVNLAVIPEVRTDAAGRDGEPEGFLAGSAGLPPGANLPAENKPSRSSALRSAGNGHGAPTRTPISSNSELVNYLKANPGFHIVHHGCDHSLDEFDSDDAEDVRRRLDRGARLLAEAGFPQARTFVAPYDRLSRVSLREVIQRFRVLSTGWFELQRLPVSWWPAYALKKTRHSPHWQIGHTALLSHPGCLLSHRRPRASMLEAVKAAVARSRLTVLVTHWWEYFPAGRADTEFINILHNVAEWLADEPAIRVVSFDDLAIGKVPLE